MFYRLVMNKSYKDYSLLIYIQNDRREREEDGRY